ncbi:hypothetical protein [Chryseobacterium sp. MMS23-Vi53]|uniref:hypothetical protein n=1 Tax=Chryseobacterium sp. MMS23-Vi53 TaxID=3386644 RepID=UPI0039E73570
MNIILNHFKEPHLVILIFKQSQNFNTKEFNAHKNYYKNLKGFVEAVYYGKVMNDNSIGVIIRSSCADDFEKIIENDPAVKSNIFHLQQIIPLTDNFIENSKLKPSYQS